MSPDKILIVDDNLEIISFLKQRVLSPLGLEVVTAYDGRTGLQLALAHIPDLILLDMSLPQMSGIEMLRALREALYQTPVIFMTSYGSEQVIVEAFRLGVRDFLSKPFTSEEAHEVIKRVLQENRTALDKDKLMRDLIVSETIRQTVVTLSHYINNDLFILSGGLGLVRRALNNGNYDPAKIPDIIQDSQVSVERISAVMRVLRRIIDVEPVSYHGEIMMIDIEQALEEEMQHRTGKLG